MLEKRHIIKIKHSCFITLAQYIINTIQAIPYPVVAVNIFKEFAYKIRFTLSLSYHSNEMKIFLTRLSRSLKMD